MYEKVTGAGAIPARPTSMRPAKLDQLLKSKAGGKGAHAKVVPIVTTKSLNVAAAFLDCLYAVLTRQR